MSLDIRRDGEIVTLTLNRPPVNAVDTEMVQAVSQAASAARNAAAVILTGTGPVFCAGVDTKAFAGYGAAQRTRFVQAINEMCAALLALPCPLVAAVNGHALGGGFVMMLCADWRLATDSDTAQFGLPEARAGIAFPAGPAAIIAAEIPAPWLRRWALSSEATTARALVAAGIMDETVPPPTLLEAAQTAALRLSAQRGFRTVKQQLRGQLARAVAEAAARADPFSAAFKS